MQEQDILVLPPLTGGRRRATRRPTPLTLTGHHHTRTEVAATQAHTLTSAGAMEVITRPLRTRRPSSARVAGMAVDPRAA